MKKKFSTSWKSSKQVRKQRKYIANAPKHLIGKLMSANLSKELRKKYSKRSFPIRKGDEVKVRVGKYEKKTGKISVVNRLKRKVAIEGLQRQKKDGTKINIWFDASNLQIQKLNLGDKKRVACLERKRSNKKVENKTDRIVENKEVKKVDKKEQVMKEKKNA